MRIAFIHPFIYRYPRGIERYTLSLANALARAGDEIHLLTWRWPKPVSIETLDLAVQVHLMPTSRYYAAQAVTPFYVAHLARQRYDRVWIFFAGYGEAETLTLSGWQPFGIVLHYPIQAVPHRYREFQRYGLASRAQHIIAVSQFVADGARQFFRQEIGIIGHGVDAQKFAPDLQARLHVRDQLGLASDVPLIVTAAALEERKGVQWMLRALPAVLGAHPELRYLVLGDGPYRATLERLAHDLSISDRVLFLGAQERIVPFYQAADLAIILSRHEASSLTSLEALACGVPVVAADRRPFDELIKPEYGVLVSEEQSSHVAQTVTALLHDQARRQTLGACGRAHMLLEHTWESVSTQYKRLSAH